MNENDVKCVCNLLLKSAGNKKQNDNSYYKTAIIKEKFTVNPIKKTQNLYKFTVDQLIKIKTVEM